MTKTTEVLKDAVIMMNDEVVETIEIKNPCQMWRQLQGWRIKYGNSVRIIVHRADGTAYKDFTVKLLKNGKTYMVNAVKETNRATVMKAKKAAAEAKAQEDARQAEIEAKKAKKRAYEKARRERRKAEKASRG